MPAILKTTHGRAIALIPRSGSHTIATAMIETYYPNIDIDLYSHPAASYPDLDQLCEIAVLVRNPIERFRSMVVHAGSTVEEQLIRPRYGCEFCHNRVFDKYFRFEDQLQVCADWLGITVPLQQLNASNPELKPILTPEEEAQVRQIYYDDIILWESI